MSSPIPPEQLAKRLRYLNPIATLRFNNPLNLAFKSQIPGLSEFGDTVIVRNSRGEKMKMSVSEARERGLIAQRVDVNEENNRGRRNTNGRHSLQSSFFKLLGYDPDTQSSNVPNLQVPSYSFMRRCVDLWGLKNVGDEYTAKIDVPGYGVHGYIYAVVVGHTMLMAQRGNRSEKSIRAAFRNPALMLGLWSAFVMHGGIALTWQNVPRLINGGDIDVQVGSDPVRFQGMVKQRSIDGGSLLTLTALTKPGHALTGVVMHNLVVTEDGRVIAVWIGAGGHWTNISGGINNFVATNQRFGMWTNFGRAFREAFSNPGVINSLCDKHETSAPEELYREIVKIKKPDEFLARALNRVGDVPRTGSDIYYGIRDWRTGNVSHTKD